MANIFTALRGNQLSARAVRSSVLIAGGYVAGQALRLASNLILARLLFPEAFGLMALVTVLMVGLTMFSDVGLGPAISRSPRGRDPEFLNTGWTLMVMRGVLLWLITCALAWPVSLFYGEPLLAWLLPVAGLALLIQGFNPTRIDSAQRELIIGRLTLLDLASQAIGIFCMVAFALVYASVWALVVGGIVGSIAKLVLTDVYLPGARNKFRLEKQAFSELLHFGKWIFLSTAFGFFVSQGDKAILGKFLSLEGLGIYNIGYFLASFPVLLGMAVVSRVMIPLYRERPPWDSEENARKLRQMRVPVTGVIIALLGLLALIGVPLVDFLYDDRYLAAGAIVVSVSCIQMLVAVTMTYDQVALAAGDSRNYFFLTLIKAIFLLVCLYAGALFAGLVGALVGQVIAAVLTYPFIARVAKRHRAWDPRHDLGFSVIGAVIAALSIWLNRDALLALNAFGS